MTLFAKTILAVMLQLVPAPDGELERYTLIAATVADVAQEDCEAERTDWSATELAAMLIATMRHESSFDRKVHDGRVRGDSGRSTCLAQINKGARTTARGHRWSTLAGTDEAATRRCIETAADHIEVHAKACGRSFGCVMARYQGHKSRRNAETRKRVATFWRVYAALLQGRVTSIRQLSRLIRLS